ncbi:MAG: hypothetical protein FWF51_04000 [Chitinivibrionia bacterium]|nr:hypothetical protein [Chitinivibrionia bacterium]
MTQNEENKLIESIEQNEWKRVQNFSAMKKELVHLANLTKAAVFDKTRKMASAR